MILVSVRFFNGDIILCGDFLELFKVKLKIVFVNGAKKGFRRTKLVSLTAFDFVESAGCADESACLCVQ